MLLVRASIASLLAFRTRRLADDAGPGGDRGLHADVLQFAHFARRRDALRSCRLDQIVDVLTADGRAGVGRDDGVELDRHGLGFFRDLSTGGLVRQHRETDWQGNFLAKQTRKGPPPPKGAQRYIKSAFDDGEQYELTALGEQFVHCDDRHPAED
jgi:hypothetical protein